MFASTICSKFRRLTAEARVFLVSDVIPAPTYHIDGGQNIYGPKSLFLVKLSCDPGSIQGDR